MRLFYAAVSMIALSLPQTAISGETSFWSTDWLFGDSDGKPSEVAQAKQPALPKTGQVPQASPPAQQGSDTQAPEKTETTNFDNWILTCREFVEGPKKRSCAMTVSVRKSDTNRPVLSWTVRPNDKGQLVNILETLPGIMIAPGLELKLDTAAAPRKVPIEICEPNWCSGSLAMDKTFAQEITAASKVTITITSSAGQPIALEFPVKGFDKAYAKM